MESGTINPATLCDLEALVSRGVAAGFYLAGGTGLAMHLGHRESHDLDFFSAEPFSEDVFMGRLAVAGKFTLEKKEAGTVRGIFHNTLVSFLSYPYPLLEPFARGFGVEVASIPDIACMKLDALASRGARRDFMDIYCIIKQGALSLPHLLDLFTQKYAAVNYNLMHIKKGLTYFEDAEREPMPMMSDPVAWDTIRDFFISEVNKL